MAKVPATKLSLEYLRGRGMLAEVVERRIPMKPFPKTKDLFDFVDIVGITDKCYEEPRIVFVQTTSLGHKSHRIAKMEGREIADKFYCVQKVGDIELHCWFKAAGAYEVKVFRLRMEYGPDSKDHITASVLGVPTMAAIRAELRKQNKAEGLPRKSKK